MNKKRVWTALAALGVVCLFLPLALTLLGYRDVFPERSDLLCSWLGSILTGRSLSVLSRIRRQERDPSFSRQQKAQNDEGNQSIRDRAGYLAGVGLLMLTITIAMVFLSFGSLGVPQWVIWLLIVLAVFHCLTFWALSRWLQRKM